MFIVKVPGLNGSGRSNGCESSGNAILKTVKEEIFSNESGFPIDFGSLDLEEIHLDNSKVEYSNHLIYKNSSEIFENKPKTIFLGGDHSISFSTTLAFLDYCKKEKKKPCLIVFDAHPDLMPVLDINTPTIESWLSALISAGFPKDSILLVGVRNLSKEETTFIKTHNIRVINTNKIVENIDDICDVIMEFSSGKELYVSIDIDAIDPAFAPSTAYPEPAGISSREMIYLIQRINKIKKLRALDLVNINAEKDLNNLTIKLGAKILSEIIP